MEYLRQMNIILLHVDQMCFDEDVDGFVVVFILVPMLDQTPSHVLVCPLRPVRLRVLYTFQNQNMAFTISCNDILTLVKNKNRTRSITPGPGSEDARVIRSMAKK